jgi:DNA modification methylase
VYPALNGIPNLGTTEAGRRCVKSVIEIANKKGKGKHPTQKPDDLYAFLIERYSKEGDTILDPTAGSFASVFTAERLGRKGIGIEKDDTFYAKATI